MSEALTTAATSLNLQLKASLQSILTLQILGATVKQLVNCFMLPNVEEVF